MIMMFALNYNASSFLHRRTRQTSISILLIYSIFISIQFILFTVELIFAYLVIRKNFLRKDSNSRCCDQIVWQCDPSKVSDVLGRRECVCEIYFCKVLLERKEEESIGMLTQVSYGTMKIFPFYCYRVKSKLECQIKVRRVQTVMTSESVSSIIELLIELSYKLVNHMVVSCVGANGFQNHLLSKLTKTYFMIWVKCSMQKLLQQRRHFIIPTIYFMRTHNNNNHHRLHQLFRLASILSWLVFVGDITHTKIRRHRYLCTLTL